MLWHIIKYWCSFLIPVFYKKIQSRNIQNIQVKEPVIIAMNHPNAFTDPIVLTYVCYPPKLKYLARGDAFKPGLISWFLEQIGIIPIFRLQDGGKEGLKKNDEAYRRVNAFLKKKAKVIVFAEGLCIQEKRLRPLKKGVARMVFGAYEAIDNDKLTVVPVGINYSKPDKFRSKLFYNVGEPILVKDYIEEYRNNPARANNKFLQDLELRMKELITHIEDPTNDLLVHQTEKLLKKSKIKEKGLDINNLYHDFLVSKEITALVNKAWANQPDLVNTFREKTNNYFNNLKKHRLKDWLIDPHQNKNVTTTRFVLRCCLLIIGAPFYLLGLTGNLLPLWLTDKLARKIAKNKEFYSSMALGISMLVFLINYLIWFFVSYSLSTNIFLPLFICFILMITGGFCLWYHPFALQTLGIARIIKNKLLSKELKEQRQELILLINKF